MLRRYARSSARAGRLPLPRLRCAGKTEAIDQCSSPRSWKIPVAAHDLTLPRMSLEGASHPGDANEHKPSAGRALAGAASNRTRANATKLPVKAAPPRYEADVRRSCVFAAHRPRATCCRSTSLDQEISSRLTTSTYALLDRTRDSTAAGHNRCRLVRRPAIAKVDCLISDLDRVLMLVAAVFWFRP